MKTFKPTYLYIKQHTKTGKLYFGKTIRNPIAYLGSGVHWTRHINSYGKEYVITLWYELFVDPFELAAFAISFSNKLQISKENSTWLNIVPESGFTGGNHGKYKTKEYIRNLSNSLMNHSTSQETKNKISAALTGIPKSEEHRVKMKNTQYNKNRPPISDEARKRMSLAKLGKPRTQETKDKISKAQKGVPKKHLIY